MSAWRSGPDPGQLPYGKEQEYRPDQDPEVSVCDPEGSEGVGYPARSRGTFPRKEAHIAPSAISMYV